MDSAGLAQAVTNYWSEIYNDQEEDIADNSFLLIISIAGIHRRIKRVLTSRTV